MNIPHPKQITLQPIQVQAMMFAVCSGRMKVSANAKNSGGKIARSQEMIFIGWTD
jgi:hypothetical protein